jgi:hypothetical protein
MFSKHVRDALRQCFNTEARNGVSPLPGQTARYLSPKQIAQMQELFLRVKDIDQANLGAISSLSKIKDGFPAGAESLRLSFSQLGSDSIYQGITGILQEDAPIYASLEKIKAARMRVPKEYPQGPANMPLSEGDLVLIESLSQKASLTYKGCAEILSVCSTLNYIAPALLPETLRTYVKETPGKRSALVTDVSALRNWIFPNGIPIEPKAP